MAQGERTDKLSPAADKVETKTRVLEKAGLTRQTANRCEISKALEKSVGGRPKTTPAAEQFKTKKDVLSNAGLTQQTANRCEKLVDIPEEIFEGLGLQYIAA